MMANRYKIKIKTKILKYYNNIIIYYYNYNKNIQINITIKIYHSQYNCIIL
jgi:hypothetical protein